MLQAVRSLTEMARTSDAQASRSDRDTTIPQSQTSTSTSETFPSAVFREIHKDGWLRRPDIKNEKEQRCWVIFYIYGDSDPRLEGFTDQKQSTTHNPTWSQSLRSTHYLSPTLCATSKNDYEFCVNLADDTALRLAAPTYPAMLNWVHTITRKLMDLRVLKPKENLYSKPPERSATRDPTSPLPPPPNLLVQAAVAGTSGSPSTSNTPMVFTFDNIFTLDERRASIRQHNRPAPSIPLSPRLGGNHGNTVESSYDSVFLASSSYSQSSESSRSNNNQSANRSHSSSDESNQYAALIEYRSFDNADTTVNSNSSSSSIAAVPASSQNRQPRIHLRRQFTLREMQVLQLRKEMNHPAGVRIKLGRRECKDGIAFVDCFGAVWIAGWKSKEHPLLYNVLHIGDLVLSIAGVSLNGASSVRDIIKSHILPHVEVIVRRLPHGRVTRLTRTIESEDFGIEISPSDEIVSVSPAAQSLGLSVMANPADPSAEIGTTVGWTLTEVNNKPLNLFESKARERVNASYGRDVSIVLQPSDLVCAIKKKLRAVRNYKSFVQ